MTEDYKSLDAKTKVLMVTECRAIYGIRAASELWDKLDLTKIRKKPLRNSGKEIVSVLTKKVSMTRSEALRRFRWMNSGDLDEEIGRLTEAGLIEVHTSRPTGAGRPLSVISIKKTPPSS